MNQKDLILSVADQSGLSAKDATAAVRAVTDSIAAALAKGTSVRTGLGTFSISKRAARKGRNPATGEAIRIAASKTVRFKAAKAVKDKVNKRRAAPAAKTKARGKRKAGGRTMAKAA